MDWPLLYYGILDWGTDPGTAVTSLLAKLQQNIPFWGMMFQFSEVMGRISNRVLICLTFVLTQIDFTCIHLNFQEFMIPS